MAISWICVRSLHILRQIVWLRYAELTVFDIKEDLVLVHEVLAKDPSIFRVLFYVDVTHAAVQDRH